MTKEVDIMRNALRDISDGDYSSVTSDPSGSKKWTHARWVAYLGRIFIPVQMVAGKALREADKVRDEKTV